MITVDGKPTNKLTGLAVAPDGTLFAADAGNHRILHIDDYGKVLGKWGTFASSQEGQTAPPGAFNEPWGVALDPDGSVYVADTWNHRIQKFDSQGEFITSWGEGGTDGAPDHFFGPRGIAISSQGWVLLTDTGNARVLVYDSQGSYKSQIGGKGQSLGQFMEPVGIAVGEADQVFVADSFNQRVQVLALNENGVLTPQFAWPVQGWKSQSMDHKPFIAVCRGTVFLTNPEADQVLSYTAQGELLETYNLDDTGSRKGGIASGIACDPEGGVWASDLTIFGWAFLLPPE
jgi:DNA-binding beta-propeller fold protein YncE